MEKIVMILFLLLMPSVVLAGDWTPVNSVVQTTTTTVLIVDWLQTRQIAKNPSRWTESNIILGKHPHVDRVDAYFAGVIIGQAVVAYLVPDPYRTLLQSGVIGLEVVCINKNYSAGVRARW